MLLKWKSEKGGKDMFSGALTAIVTPFKNGKVDENCLKDLIEFQIEQGINGIVPCGTTGESPTLTHDEHDRVIQLTVEVVNKRVPVLAGTGSNSTEEAVKLTKHAEKIGADGALLITPYYNKPTQEGLIAHFEAVAAHVSIPIVLYNVPGRTGVNLLPKTVIQLSKNKKFWGVKEASGSIVQASEIIRETDMKVLSGDDSLTFPLISVGGAGVISVTSNIIPGIMTELVRLAKGSAEDINKAQQMHLKYLPLFKDLFIETSPSPIKAAMNMVGLIENELRLPLVPLSHKNRDRISQLLSQLEISQWYEKTSIKI